MIGLTTLISIISGMITGVVPDLVKEFRDSRIDAREAAALDLQHRHYMERLRAEADAKVHQSAMEASAAEMTASLAALKAAIETPLHVSGVQWIDTISAAIRPATAYVCLAALIAIIFGLTDVVPREHGAALVVGAIEAVFGFYFGSRQVRKQAVS